MHLRIAIGLVAGTLLGALVHALAPEHPLSLAAVSYLARPIGQIFLRMLFVLVLPLVFSSLALGIAEIGDPRKLGRTGIITLLYTLVLSTIAVGIGVAVVNLLQPGVGLDPAVREQLLSGAADRASAIISGPPPKSGVELLVKIIPDNLVRAASENDMIAVMFASGLLGVALTLVNTDGTRALRLTLQGIADVSMRLIAFALSLAPFGVAGLMFALTVELGLSVLLQLGAFVLTVLLGLGLQQFVVFPLVVWLLGGMHPLTFFRGVQPAMLTAFSTASSSATLPTTLAVADEMGLPKQVSRFVLTVGATANQNGTALFEGVTVLFLAQFYGVELSISQQFLVSFVCVLGGIGTAGVPAGSLPVVAMILGMIGVPPEGIGLVLGVDRLLDMCRTTLNVTGDLAATVVVSRVQAS